MQPMVARLEQKRNRWLRYRRRAVVPDSIAREIVIDAPPERVWAIVTEARHLAGWFSDEAEIDLRPGGAMLLTWHGHGSYQARVETVDPPRTFAFRWLRREDAEGSTLVVMTLTPEGATHPAPRGRERLRGPRLAGGRAGPLRRREPRSAGASSSTSCVAYVAGR